MIWVGMGVCGAACSNFPSDSSQEEEGRNGEGKPNFILIMADDLGYGGIGSYGNTDIQTPHLDKMAERGVRFTQYYANSTVCTPTRAAMMTGRYQQRTGLEGVIYVRGETREVGMAQKELTVAEVLKSLGYATGIMGKWHLGYKKEYFPTRQGFDTFYGYVSGNIDFHSHYDNAGIFDWWHNEDSLVEEGYVTDLITQHSIDFIEEHQEEPFFLYIAHEAPHVPLQGRNDTAFRYPGREFPYMGVVENQEATYKEMVEVMDEGIGEIWATLERLDLATNTVVIFVSDNGGREDLGDNGGLKGAKTNLFEGGIRVPGIVRWENQVQAAVSDEIVMSFDWMPTFLTLAGYDALAELSLDGVDLTALLQDQQSLEERSLFWRYRSQKVVRKGKWKLLVDEEMGPMLYDLAQDMRESTNRADEYPEQVEALESELRKWEEEVTDNHMLITR